MALKLKEEINRLMDKANIAETFIENTHTSTRYYAYHVLDIPYEEFKELSWREQSDHYIEDEEGLVKLTPVSTYTGEIDDRAVLALELEQVVRKAIEKWVKG